LHINARPAEALDRAVPGLNSAIATLVERSTRFVILVGLPDGKLSEHVATQLAAAMACGSERG
jgi:hypothetical protein